MRGPGEKKVRAPKAGDGDGSGGDGTGGDETRPRESARWSRWPRKGLKAAGPDGPDSDSNRPIMQ